ncbi:4'-phosphopantetheinyl transferase family protein [Saccharothrix xinjiangensis]|uniref:4'-phosphopantetheinyl transferase family protein n=1 Tax=Saccharothrix xinjiangensis TaxID=204798 RepID=A0ABV9Y395_9PSEU
MGTSAGAPDFVAPAWPPGPRRLAAAPGAVDVWRVALSGGARAAAACLPLLPDAERDRAARLGAASLRHDHVVAHGALHDVLSRYLDRPARRIALVRGEWGRPELDGGGLSFNLSHTDGCAVVAVAADGPVGVDVEALRAFPGGLALARRFFTRAEADRLARLAEPARSELFLRTWTCKESCLKATGRGLSGSPASVDVDPRRVEPAPGWAVRELRPSARHVAALAVPGEAPRVRRWTWERPAC